MDQDASGDVELERVANRLVRRVPVTSPEATIASLRADMDGTRFETVTVVAVCEGGQLRGVLRIEDVVAADGSVRVSEIMDTDPPVVAPGTDQEQAAWHAVHHGESAIAVVDADGTFVGVVPPDRLLAVLLHEHDEDMARIGGFTRAAWSARRSTEEPIPRRFVHRLPWLLVGLVGAIAAADIVGAFERVLTRNVVLAFFVPGIVYMAGAVGTQTVTLLIRGLSVGVPIRRVVGRELLTGVLVGSMIALVFVPLGLWRWREGDIVVAVALALYAACSTATAIAIALPWLLRRVGLDPAFGSGPLATVVQDLLSVVIYLSIATAIVN